MDDIPALVEHFVHRFSREMGRSVETIPPEVMNVLRMHDWPGNIRELENIIRRAVIVSTEIPFVRCSESSEDAVKASPAAKRTMAEAEREHIVEVLQDTRWVLGETMALPLGWECRGQPWSIECASLEFVENKNAGPSEAISASSMPLHQWVIGREICEGSKDNNSFGWGGFLLALPNHDGGSQATASAGPEKSRRQ